MSTRAKQKVIITGAECSGKSTLSASLALHYDVLFAPEYARYYLDSTGPSYKQHDLMKIAEGQQQSINYLSSNQDLVISDTDLLTIKIWSEYKYGSCDKLITETLRNNLPDLYLLCSPDIPWIFDALRENPDDRQELHEIYIREIAKLKVPVIKISGTESQRFNTALKAVEKLRSQS